MTPEEKQRITDLVKVGNLSRAEFIDFINAMPEESEYDKFVQFVLTDEGQKKVANQITKRKIEDYKTSLVMYKKSTIAVLDRIIDWLDQGGE